MISSNLNLNNVHVNNSQEEKSDCGTINIVKNPKKTFAIFEKKN